MPKETKDQCIELLLIIESETGFSNRGEIGNRLHKQTHISNHEEIFTNSSRKQALKTDYYLVCLPINIHTPSIKHCR
jgi:hypothetical protein